MRRVDMNEPKIQSELFTLIVKFNDIKQSKEFRRWTPQAKEVLAILDDMLRLCKLAIHERQPITFELSVFEQSTLGGAFFEITPSEVAARVEYAKYGIDDKEFGLEE